MATYNGEKYIKQQLDSILGQSNTDWELFIFDDKSDDATVEIVTKISESDQRIKVFTNEKNVGVTQNFLRALEEVYQLHRFEYFMFCDQDDVWLPDKLALTLNRMTEEEKDTEIVLVHTDLKLVDASGDRVIAESFRRRAHLKHITDHVFERLLAQPFVFGCTSMMNGALVQHIFPVPEQVYAHDSWVSLIAAALGKIAYIDRPSILFRQHTLNTSGTASASSLGNRIRRVTAGWEEQVGITKKRVAQCEALLLHIKSPFKGRDVLEEYCSACRTSAIRSIKISVNNSVLRQGFFANILYFITLFFLERK